PAPVRPRPLGLTTPGLSSTAAPTPSAWEPSTWSARSPRSVRARTNDVDRDEHRRTTGRRGKPDDKEDPPSQLRPAVPRWTGRRAGPDADWAMAHHGDAASSLAPGPSPSRQPERTPADPTRSHTSAWAPGTQPTKHRRAAIRTPTPAAEPITHARPR